MSSQQENSPTIRCAIYTRKSTEEGLDQEFNSLDAQRESAETYIASQRYEGWTVLPDRYDDGGFTGGNMERPALRRLLQDVATGGIDCIVVYKVDRLSRSLLDFARIMEVLEQNRVKFVSVTQQFNTTHSMGRLTLNILLSFAQFEREIIAERTRDKMSAARRKGKWVGGVPVLGYDVHPKGGKILVNETEASRVRGIFELYLQERALIPTVKELAKRGWTGKRWTTKKGRERGGRSFDKTSLYKLLTNIIYIGKVSYKNEVYEGEHGAIVSQDIFERVQTLLRDNRLNGGRNVRNRYGAILKGLLYCGACDAAMVHAYTVRGDKRYRYYVCSKAQKNGWHTCSTKSLPAAGVERFVVDTIRNIGKDDMLAAEVIRQAREQSQGRVTSLQNERLFLESELANLDKEIRRLIKSMGPNADEGITTSRLAELQDRMRETEQNATCVRQELLELERLHIDEEHLATALSLFDPVWDNLLPQEKIRAMQLLVEQVRYEPKSQKVSVTFRPSGIRTLCAEAGIGE